MKLFYAVLLGLIAITAQASNDARATESPKPCPKNRTELCDEAALLAQKIKEASARVDDVSIEVRADRWIIIYKEISSETLADTSPEAVAIWASRIQHHWCAAWPISNFLRRGGEFFYKLDSDSGEALAPTVAINCL